MGKRLWLAAVLTAGMILTASCGKRHDVQAKFVPGTETIAAAQVHSQQVILPFVLENGMLIAEELVEYAGPYVEDGSHEPVSGVAALMLYNSGDRDISSAMVAVNQGVRVLHFFVTWLPAGQRVLVLEQERKAYSREEITDCRSFGLRWECFYPSGAAVSVQDYGGGLTVKNCSARRVTRVRLRYKTYIPEGDFYLGGITHCSYVGTLEFGEERVVYPERYAPECAKIVAVLTQ